MTLRRRIARIHDGRGFVASVLLVLLILAVVSIRAGMQERFAVCVGCVVTATLVLALTAWMGEIAEDERRSTIG